VTKLATWIITQLRGEETAGSADKQADETRAQIEHVASQHASEVPAAEIERIAGNLRSGEAAANLRMIQ
jgi:hypothetical protein